MKNFRLRLQAMCIALVLGIVSMSAQEIRYVTQNGAGAKNGSDWTNAAANIQDAINDLVNNNKTGEVWVAAGIYYPTESTESSSSPYYKSFKIPAGITVRGGFVGTETSADQRQLKNDKYFGKVKNDGKSENTGNLDGEAAGSGRYVNETILRGDLSQSKIAGAMTWNPDKKQFDITFYGNSYHVVWFAMNGFDASGRANPLAKPAKLEGCIVENGHAYSLDVAAAHPHAGYGGGIYMVANSFVYNCEVRNCDASRNGGGIYMDGGGIVRRTHVHDCQALGIGTEFGLGGGICEDGAKHNSKANPVVVAQSVVTNCVGRMGGGMALSGAETTGNNKYAVVANSTLVSNNTAQIEAGGVYTYKGGGLASLTVARNKCFGSGVMQNDVITGRAGGVYNRDAAYFGNNVIWGNECEANKDVQYASSRTNLSDSEKTKFFYNAISKADNTDWSGTTKMGVLSLADENKSSGEASSLGYPLFFNPTATAGYSEQMTPVDGSKELNWTVSSESYLTHAGIATVDLDYEGLTPAPAGKSWDMQFGEFNARPTLGAFISQVADIAPADNVTYNNVTYAKAFFVDPSFIYASDNEETNGQSWTKPARFLGHVLDYIAGKNYPNTYKIAIFVKEGTVDNTRTKGGSRIRTTSLEIPSNVSLFGSFDGSLTGTTLGRRNIVKTPTVISGKLLDSYNYNIAHLISIDGSLESKKNITIDGFKLTLANATSTELANENKTGAAITIKNSTVGIKFKNVIVSNSLAELGAAIYADKATADFENCIFHNNTTSQINNSGVVYATNDSHLTFNHCDVLRNVGHASYLGSNGTNNVWKNSIFYGNMDRSLPDTNSDAGGGINYALAAFSGTTANATGSYCMFDSKSALFASQFGNGTVTEGGDTGNKWQYNLQYAFVDGTGQGYPRFINPTKNSGYSENGDVTYYGRATSFEPHNNNPMVNEASYTDAHTTWGYDLVGTTRDFGGTPDIGAVENHKTEQYDEDGNTIENAYLTGQPAWSDGIKYVRQYSGELATKTLTEAEQTLYDGSSWDRAIIGNAMYAYKPGTIETSTAVNTYVKTDVQSTDGTFKGFKLQIGGKYLAQDGTTGVKLVNNENEASVWLYNTSTTATTSLSSITAGSNNRYFWVKDGNTKRYLTITNSSGYKASLTTTAAAFTVAMSGNNFTLRRRVSSTNVYLRVVDGAFACSTSNSNNIITPTSITEGGTNKVIETFVKADGTSTGVTKVMDKAGNSRVSVFKELHVYNTLEELTKVINADGVSPVAYNIANLNYKNITQEVPETDSDGNETGNYNNVTVEVDGDPTYLTTSGTSLAMNYTKSSSSKYALINAGSATLNDLVYIYDITAKKYVSYSGTTFSLTNETTNAAWRIKQSAKANRLNIIPSSVSEDASGEVNADASGWNYNSSTLSLSNRAENASQWVFENDLQYEVYNTNVTTPSGEVRINGLQYAVNMVNKGLKLKPRQVTVTETYNKGNVTLVRTYQDLPEGTEDGQVWVAAGTYENYSTYDADPAGYVSDAFGGENINKGYGYLMRNHVKVYGGFPKSGNPGMDERHPQLTDKVAMSAVNIAKNLNYQDYETILQTQTADQRNSKTHQGSVLAQPYECAVTEKYHSNRPRSRVIYEGAEWDGFTIRNGYRSGFATTTDGGRRVGGPGVLVYENVVIRNCIIRDNELSGKNQCRGGGVYCDGGILENCYVLDNKTNCSTSNFGGGIYMIQGTMFNSVIAGNQLVGNANPQGAGIFIESAKFYNNTIVNNTGGPAVGIYAASKASADLTVYNTIIIAGAGQRILQRADVTTPTEFVHCYLKSDQEDGTGVHSILSGQSDGKNYVIIRDGEDGPYTSPRERQNKIYLANSSVVATGFTYAKINDLSEYNPFAKEYTTATTNYDYRIEQKAANINCVNAATEDIGNAELPDFDMDYADRIQDCDLDIGAYEYNGVYSLQPVAVNNQVVFYVTPYGKGTSAGNNPENAACAQKLQKILDAAGRYKYVHPDHQVIVKVANDYTMANPTDGSDPAHFKYYATRTTDYTDQDVRVWSIEVPRGVELWGGYSDVPMKMVDGKVVKDTENSWSNEHNGFNSVTTDLRDITGNPTYFDSYYYNKDQKSDANTYHVITFTDRIYDPEGYAYMKDEESKIKDHNADLSTYRELVSNDESQFAHMSKKNGADNVVGNVINIGTAQAPIYASNRAVIDGIFVTGGSANGSVSSNSASLNINGFGGAAIVPDYAYVRNCILLNNKATNGGALALANGALVSGSLIMYNEAEEMGGGIYVFEEGTTLSNGTVINSKAPAGQVLDYNMAHVLTSTIVANKAEQGGGVWFANEFNGNNDYYKINARFNSVAIWENDAADQKNVFGMLTPEQPTDDETTSEIFYPFAYSVIENLRASGTNNQSIDPLNRDGVRFVDKTNDIGQSIVNQNKTAKEASSADLKAKFANFGYYGLTHYSLLCSMGMPVNKYNQLIEAMAISDVDILGTSRISADNNFVEVGARALAKSWPTKQLMLRLFVANKEVNKEMADKFMELTGETGSAAEYYSQMGSSFAYPFNTLQDALDYVKRARNGKIISGNTDAQNLPFEILVGKGEYYPQQDLNGETKSVWANTFAIPEGVTIIGGFSPVGGNGTYYGRYYKPVSSIDKTSEGSIYSNVVEIPSSTATPGGGEIGRGNKYGTESVTVDGTSITFQQWHIQDIADRRAMNDNNKNGIIEPWEFMNQTIISGNAVNGETDGVYHVMTAVADANAVGLMPKVQKTNGDFKTTSVETETGYQWKEQGQQIRLNGLIITGGNALTYLKTALDDYGSYIFYQGAGLQVDGNRYNTSLDATPVFHNSAAYGVGYRDIPVSITNCQFRNNKAGYGGAISSNGSLSIFASSFEQNLAIAQTETPKAGEKWISNVGSTSKEIDKVMYPGQGGAILATHQLSAFNTLFANNEARMGEDEVAPYNGIALVKHQTFRVPVQDDASATLRAAGGAIMMGSAAEHHIVNCDFVRNKANAYPAVFTMNPTVAQTGTSVNTHNYSQIINTVAWGNEVNPEMLEKFSSNTAYQTASKLMVNIGKKDRSQSYIKTKTTDASKFYSPAFVAGNVPSKTVLDNTNAESTEWQEAVWFCAYEDGVGFKHNNTNDLRDVIVYAADKYAPKMIMDANGGVYQNCNLQIVANNRDVAGPNFGNPSARAGYDGFTEDADWSPTRFNRLTDNGNGWIKQTVTEIDTDDDSKVDDIKVTFNNVKSDVSTYQGAYPVTHYIDQFPEYALWLALGNEKYMQSTTESEATAKKINGTDIGTPKKNLPRISPDPTLGVEKAYIDIGVYEYVKQPLLKPGNEVDILWVATEEKPGADGSTRAKPTSDLQRAIKTLLSSRNGHKKEIRLIEGEYTPVTPQTVGGTKYNAFVIDTKSLNGSVITPSTFNDGTNNDQYFAQSLTIKGGYSATTNEYDPAQFKSVIRQSEADGANTNYLIYIADPTVRYAGTEGTKQGGAIGANTGEAASVKTMPIQVDGVTLVNDKAASGTKGSAIYYPDYTGTIPPESGVTGAHTASVGGTVKYYMDAKHKTPSPDNAETDFPLIDDTGSTTISDTKLLITKAMIVGSGNKENLSTDASAVYIGEKGGAALIYNTVFHTNYGMPLDAWNTINVNNTFGKNAGLVHLQDAAGVTSVKSQIHNSAMWRNNNDGAQFSMPGVTVETTVGDTQGDVSGTGIANFTYNSFTGGNIKYADYTEAEGHVATNKFNTGLSNENKDLANGPNFVDPDNADVESRSFDIRPSVRLLNKGNDENITSGTGKYYTLVVSNKYDLSLASTTDKDALTRNRLAANKIDVGAYEFQGNLQKVLYVDPNKSHRDDATGENWGDAFGYGDLQDAMDLAGIYHMNNPLDESYVFVKGASSTNKDLTTNETLTIRDGVTVYGSIISSYTDWHDILKDPSDPSKGKKYATIDAFIKDMTSQREGVASNAASKTVVTGIKTSEYTSFNGGGSSDTPALVDGFVVTDPNPTNTPVLDVTNKSEDAVIVVRNVVVADNNVTGGANVAEISNGLIYEALFRDNKTTGAALKVANYPEGAKTASTQTSGYAVNVTVEGKTIGADNSTPVDGGADLDAEKAAQIFKSITNSINSGSGANKAGANAPYGAITNPGISGKFYNIADPNLNYQLTETSKYIDMCELDVDAETGHPTFLPAGQAKTATQPFIPNLRQFVHYTTDRDILGNPRLLTGVTTVSKIDRGAFETWKVQNEIRGFQCGDDGTIASSAYSSIYDNAKHAAIKKHFYPHDGSVVYVMNDHSLVIDAYNPEHEVKPTPENPGYLLVKEGASFYGNGRPVTAAYVAVERKVRKGGSIVALPYAMDYDKASSVAKVSTDGTTGDLVLDPRVGRANKYSGNERMDWKYIFQTANTKCWDQISIAAANQGVLFEPHGQWYASGDDDNAEVTLRFTGKGTSLTDYIYTETTAASKAVTLTKYDDAESTNNGADYTDELDMGWNCFGIPYLVSEYKPYETATTAEHGEANNGKYMMNIPHTLWLYYDGKHTPEYDPEIDGENDKLVNGDGGYYSVKSWSDQNADWHIGGEAKKALWVGEGIFTQTATLDDTEALTFYRPVAPTSFATSAKGNVRYFYDATGVVEIDKDPAFGEDGYAVESTEYYTVNGMKIDKPRHGVVIIRETLTNGKVCTIKRTFK